MSSNGATVVFIDAQRPPPESISCSCDRYFVTASLSIAGGSVKSPVSMCEPCSTLLEASAESSLPCGISIRSR